MLLEIEETNEKKFIISPPYLLEQVALQCHRGGKPRGMDPGFSRSGGERTGSQRKQRG